MLWYGHEFQEKTPLIGLFAFSASVLLFILVNGDVFDAIVFIVLIALFAFLSGKLLKCKPKAKAGLFLLYAFMHILMLSSLNKVIEYPCLADNDLYAPALFALFYLSGVLALWFMNGRLWTLLCIVICTVCIALPVIEFPSIVLRQFAGSHLTRTKLHSYYFTKIYPNNIYAIERENPKDYNTLIFDRKKDTFIYIPEAKHFFARGSCFQYPARESLVNWWLERS